MKLEFTHVTKHYKDFTLDCTMQIKQGCVTGLIGRNGAGKSTAFKALLGLIRIDGGQITVDGTPLEQLPATWKESIGAVLADAGFSSYLSIKDIIPILAAAYPAFDKEKFIQRCQTFKLPIHKQLKTFSTGMRAKLKVLVAMSHGAKLLVLDEPTAGLDVIARDEILDLLRNYMEESTANSILISSHISGDLEGLCDDVYFIDHGSILMHEDMDVLLDTYGILKVTNEQLAHIDTNYILCKKKEAYGYRCLTKEKQFYLDNYPEITIEKSRIDDVITLLLNDRKEQV